MANSTAIPRDEADMDTLEIEVDRGASFALHPRQPGHLDPTQLPAPATSVLWRYRLIYPQ